MTVHRRAFIALAGPGFLGALLLVAASWQCAAAAVETNSAAESKPAQHGQPPALAESSRAASEPTITFSGLQWRVKTSVQPVGPGPNYFSDSARSVWVDSLGRLHLRIRREEGRWLCSEVVSVKSFGYGTYTFVLDSPVSDLDPRVVLGLFTWSDEPAFAHREIDIEVSRWGEASSPLNAQFVVQPWNAAGHRHRFALPSSPASSHSFTWQPARVAFESKAGSAASVRKWSFTQSGVPEAGGEKAHINLWLMGGQEPEREQEVIIRSFKFRPLGR